MNRRVPSTVSARDLLGLGCLTLLILRSLIPRKLVQRRGIQLLQLRATQWCQRAVQNLAQSCLGGSDVAELFAEEVRREQCCRLVGEAA